MADIAARNIVLTEAVYYILLSLLDPLHGYGIMQQVNKVSNGRVQLAAGTLYGALGTLMKRGWIYELPADPDSRRRAYQITQDGLGVLKGEIFRLEELLMNGKRLLKEA